jgi:hypothetical protein
MHALARSNFGTGHLLIGAMSRSMKAQDLRREPRCVLHNAVSDPDGADGEFKVYSTAHMVRDQVIRDAVPGAWWVGRPAADANVYSLHVAAAALVEWDLSRGEMIVTRWDARRGITMQRRAYP